MDIKTRVASLALVAALLAGCAADTTGETGPDPRPAADRTIGGTIRYSGTIDPTHQIIVVATRDGEQSPAYSAVIKKPGAYALSNVQDGGYTVSAFMDLGDDMGSPQANEPTGFFSMDSDNSSDPIIIQGGKGLSGIDITLRDAL